MDLLDLFAQITLDTSGYEKGLAQAENASKNVKKAFAALNSPLDNLKAKLDLKPAFEQISNAANAVAHPIETFKTKLAEASTALETKRNKLMVLQSVYESTKKKVEELTAEFNKSAKENGVTSKETQELAKKLKDAEQAASTAKDELDDYAKSVKSTGDKSKEASEQSSKFANALKSGLGTAVKVSAAAIGVAATGVAALTKSAVDNFAEYEQLVGGVETLFKKNSDTVQQYAANAFKTAGLSANEYMETVTSFSASLLQSLGGNTAAAAEVADRAITDMSDNANKMGTDMQMIQNAYQGFAKQNYTMLDNLKLGYGGTKEEMQRLLDTANEYNRQQGINTDYQIENYADIVEAIHAVQTEMGITGTTAAEAATTIQGSLSSMGAAWQNLVTGIADENADFETLIDNFVESAATALDNLLPRVKTSLEGIGKLVTELSPIIAEAIPELVNDVLPSIIQAAVNLVTALVNALVDNGDMIANTALDIIDMLVQALVDNAYSVTNGAVTLIITLVNGISDRLPDLIPAAVQIILQIVKGLADNSGALIAAAGQLVVSLGVGLIEAIPELIPATWAICESIADGIVNYDWASVSEKAMNAFIDGYDKAQKKVQVGIDNLVSAITGNESLYGGDIANVDSNPIIDNMRKSADSYVENAKKVQEAFQTYYNDGKDILGRNQEDLSNTLDESIKDLEEQQKKYSDAISDMISKNNAAIAKATSAGGNLVASSTQKTGEKQKSVLVQNMEALERLYKQREITEDTYQKRRLEYLEKHRDTESDEWTKFYDQVQTYYEKLADTEQKAAEKAAQEREKNFRTILDAYSKQVEQLQNKIDSFAEKLTGAYKDFYTFETDEEGNVTSAYATDKMTQAGKQLEEYYNQLLKFQERGIGGDMISQLADFSQEEGLATLKYWNGLTDQEIKNLQAHYDKVANLSNKVSELLHSGEAESTAEAFANNIASAVENDAQFKAIGELMLSGIIDGLNNGAFDITEAANRIYGAFDGYFQSASTVTPPSYTPTIPNYTTAATFPAAERTSETALQKTAGDVPIQGESGINVTINIQEFNNYTEDDIDTLADKILIAIQEKVKQRRVVFS